MSGPALVLPGPALAASYLEALREGMGLTSLHPLAPDALAAIEADLAGHIASLNDEAGTQHDDPPRVPSTRFWLAEDGVVLGRIGVRYGLNDRLRQNGGHIGYEIRPSRRGRGLAHAALALAKANAWERGIGPLLLTCDDTNLASARVIERGGGVLEDVIPHPDRPGALLRRYWIADGR